MEVRNKLLSFLDEKNYYELIRILLEHYYDPRYDHARQEYEGEFFDIFADNPVDAAEKVEKKLTDLSLRPQIETNKFM